MKRIVSILVFLLTACTFWLGCARRAPLPAVSPISTPTPAQATAITPAPSASPIAPTPVPDALTAESCEYTFAWMSDTQNYSHYFPDIFHAMTEFLSAERDRMRLVYVMHTGDVVSWAERESDWLVADHAMAALNGVPYGVLAGNHDVTCYDDRKSITYQYFTKHFGESRMRENACCTDVYENGRGHVDLISAGNTDYAFCYMGYPVDQGGIDWLNDRFLAYRDRVGILLVHDYFDTDLTRTEQGQLLFDGVVAKNDNLFMVLCGHRYQSRTVPIEIENPDGSTRTVLQSIVNYQAAGREGGSGYLRFIRVNEDSGTLDMLNYSPLLDDYCFFDDDENLADPYYFDPSGEREQFLIPW